jgi:hypothetical protein
MVYKEVNGEQVLARTISTFNIDNSDWIAKSPKWIDECLKDLKLISELEIRYEDCTIVDNKFLLPCDSDSVQAIEYNETYVDLTDTITGKNSDYLSMQFVNNNYGLLNLNLTFDEGETVRVYYKGVNLKASKLYNILIPNVPDNDDVFEAMSYFILIRYLQNGYTHPIYNLNSNSHVTNPFLLYYGYDNITGLRIRARNSAKKLNKLQMNNIIARQRSLNENHSKYVAYKFRKDV